MKEKRRGRKLNTRGEILSNGLYKDQWERIQSDATKQEIDAAVFHRRIIDWFYTAKEMQAERQNGDYAQEGNFKKLPKKNKNKQKE
jgi:hypothetical protein